MSASRDRGNVAALSAMLGRRSAQESRITPSLVMAAGAGSSVSAIRDEVTVAVALTAGAPYYWTGTAWELLTSAISGRRLTAICMSSVADPASSVLVTFGTLPRTGTVGASLYASAAGALTETFPGDEDNTTLDAPWVWPLGWQATADQAIIFPCDPYRPRRLSYCLEDGVSQLVIVTREYPADPS